MSLKYYIDEKLYRHKENEKYIKVFGWAFDSNNQNIDFKVLVNNSETSFDIDLISRHDVVEKHRQYKLDDKLGFCIKLVLDDNTTYNSIQIIANTSNESKTILRLNQFKLNKIIDRSKILFHIDGVFTKNKRKVSIVGWSIDSESKPLAYSVYNQNGNLVESYHHPIVRNDLFNYKYIDEDEISCGYNISFDLVKGNKYYLVIDDSIYQKKINISKEIRIQSIKTKLSFIKKVIKKIKLSSIKKIIKQIRRNGISSLPEYIKRRIFLYGKPYEDWFEEHKVTNEELTTQRNTHFNYEPLISILVPTYKTPIEFLREMIDSVINQSYSNWELCIADGSEGNKDVEDELERYRKQDSRIKYKILEKNLMISGNTNECLTLATGEYISLFDHDDILEPNALYEIVKALNEDDYDFIYTDEDKIIGEDKVHSDPHFKPDFDLDLLESENYITHFTTIRASILKEIGGFRSEYDGAQDYDIILRSIEKSKKIKHIPLILYSWRIHSLSTAGNPESKTYAYDAGVKALQNHFDRVGKHVNVENFGGGFWGIYKTTYILDDNPLVSIIIPTRDHVKDLRNCINSLDKSIYMNYEIILIENNSKNKETFDYYKELETTKSNVKVYTLNQDNFNFSKTINYGVSKSNGDYLLLLNNDTELISGNAIEQMLAICEREDVGAVGSKLLYKDDAVQHAGIVVGFDEYAKYVNTDIDKDEVGFMLHPRINKEYSAVTASCMMTKKSLFSQVNGFSEEFPLICNEVDYCLKLRELGKNIVYNGYSLWYHDAGKTTGGEHSLNNIKTKQIVKEFNNKWGNVLVKRDPMYNPNFTYKDVPYTLE